MFKIVIAFIVFACASQNVMTSTDVLSLIDQNCGKTKNCRDCTKTGTCYWEFETQKCQGDILDAAGNLTIVDPDDCPRVSVVHRDVTTEEFQYRVRVTNDHIGFFAFLQATMTKVVCVWESGVVSDAQLVPDRDNVYSSESEWSQKPIPNDGEIECNPVKRSQFNNDGLPFVRHFRVLLYPANGPAGVMLALDDNFDYYTHFYDHNCGSFFDDHCVNCLWATDEDRYYLKACSVVNHCATLPAMRLFYVNRLMLADSRINPDVLLWPINVPSRCEQDIAVIAFEPMHAVWDANPVDMTIDVRNLNVLTEYFHLPEVVVAGQNCVNVRMNPVGDDGRLTCTLLGQHGPINTTVILGPVEVHLHYDPAYPGPGEWNTDFRVLSMSVFRFDRPTLIDMPLRIPIAYTAQIWLRKVY